MKDAFDDVNGDKAVGGRVGLSVPEWGVIVGLSGLANGAYEINDELRFRELKDNGFLALVTWGF
jgi:hypothetical protein